MISLLAIQFRTKKDVIKDEQKILRIKMPHIAKIKFIDAGNTSLAWDNPKTLLKNHDGLIMCGSGEFDLDGGREKDDLVQVVAHEFLKRTEPIIDYVLKKDFPTFGICYGHQLIAAFSGATVVHDTQQAKIGSHFLSISDEYFNDPILNGVPKKFIVQYGHKDSVDRLPDGASLLANGNKCSYSFLKYKNHIYTTQFHPELDGEHLIRRIENYPDYLPDGIEAESIIKDSPCAKRLLYNFLRETKIAT